MQASLKVARARQQGLETVKAQLETIRQRSGGLRQEAGADVLRRVMRDTRPPADLRQSKAQIAA
jgi:hypothetical protein